MTDARSDSLSVDVLGRETGGVARDEEAADALVGASPDDRHVGDRAVGDPHLLSVQDPVVAVTPRAGTHRAGIRSGVGLGQTEAPERLPSGHRREPMLLLLLRAPAVNRKHRERALHRHQTADPAVAGLEFHARQPVRGRTRARAAVALEVHTEHSELAELVRELARQPGLFEPVADVRHHAVVDERPDGVADVAFLIREQVVDCEEVQWADLPRW